MKIYDSYLERFRPEKFEKVLKTRIRIDLARKSHEIALKGINPSPDTETRGYDAADLLKKTVGNFLGLRTSARQEVSRGAIDSAFAAQELCRNNPLANRIKKVWANNTVGSGITLSVDKANQEFQDKWDLWANSTDCDFYGHHTLAGLIWLWVATMVESGGVLIRYRLRKINNKVTLQFQTFEQAQLDKGKSGKNVKDGIDHDKDGRIKGYWLLDGDSFKSVFIPVSELIHMFKKERTNQHLGITFLAPIASTLDKYATYQDAKLMQQQIAACFALIMEETESAATLNNQSEGTKDRPDEIEPGVVFYAKAGSKPYTVTPPKADAASKFDISIKQDVATGSGLTYEQLTGDYSLVTFASGRMGRNEFLSELDIIQYLIVKPVLNRIFSWFKNIHDIRNGEHAVKPDWVFPPRASINPKEDFDVLMSKVRHAMCSPEKAARILGENLEMVLEQWKNNKELFGDLPFDIDPASFAATGNQVMGDDISDVGEGKGVTNDE